MKKYFFVFFVVSLLFTSCEELKLVTWVDPSNRGDDPVIPEDDSTDEFTEENGVYTFSLLKEQNSDKKSYIIMVKNNEEEGAESFKSQIKKTQGSFSSFMGIVLYKNNSSLVSFLAVLINSNGWVKIGKAESGTYKTIKADFESSNLLKGLDKENTIEVVPKDDNGNFELYINGQKECDFEYLLADYSEKSFGIMAVGDGSGNAENICYNFDIEK